MDNFLSILCYTFIMSNGNRKYFQVFGEYYVKGTSVYRLTDRYVFIADYPAKEEAIKAAIFFYDRWGVDNSNN